MQKDQVNIESSFRDFDRLGLGIDEDELPYNHLPYTFGAALVCYGILTGILSAKKKKKYKSKLDV